MKRRETIKDKSVFNDIIRHGRYKKNEYFIVYSSKTTDEKINYGVAISKKVGNAVTRNKLKRKTRAIIDKNRILFKNQHNYIIMIRKACIECKYRDLENALIKLLET